MLLHILQDRDSRTLAAIVAFAIFATITILLGMDLSVGQGEPTDVCELAHDVPSGNQVGNCRPSDIALD